MGLKILSDVRMDKGQTIEIPEEFLKAMLKSKVAKKIYDKLPPSHKKEYIKWIYEAQKDDTRARRIAKAIEMLEKKA